MQLDLSWNNEQKQSQRVFELLNGETKQGMFMCFYKV